MKPRMNLVMDASVAPDVDLSWIGQVSPPLEKSVKAASCPRERRFMSHVFIFEPRDVTEIAVIAR